VSHLRPTVTQRIVAPYVQPPVSVPLQAQGLLTLQCAPDRGIAFIPHPDDPGRTFVEASQLAVATAGYLPPGVEAWQDVSPPPLPGRFVAAVGVARRASLFTTYIATTDFYHKHCHRGSLLRPMRHDCSH
jgi:hypothetical protein